MRYYPLILALALLANVLAPRPAAGSKVPFDLTLVSIKGQPLKTLGDAQQLLAHPAAPAILLEAHSNKLRFADDADRGFGPFRNNKAFPWTHQFDEKNFALQTSAWVYVPTAGAWTFGVASDDGFAMTVNGQTFEHTSRRANRTTLSTFDFPTAGDYSIQLTYFQHLKQAELEVFAAPGTHSRMGPRQGFHLINADNFEALQLVEPPVAGDPSPGDDPPTIGSIVPEPNGLWLLGALIAVMLLRRNRPTAA